MIPKSKVVSDALDKLCASWSRNGPTLRWEELEAVFGAVYDAGKHAGELQTDDLDAKRWRTLVRHLGSLKARFERQVPIHHKQPRAWDPMTSTSTHQLAVVWRFEAVWTDLTGVADTLPAIIDVLLGCDKSESGS